MTPEQIADSLLPASRASKNTGRTTISTARDDELAVLVPRPLVRLVLRRVIARGLKARYQSVECRLPHDPAPHRSMLLLRLRAAADHTETFLSRAFIGSLGDLPGVFVARPTGSYSFLVDLRLRLPTRPPAGIVPSGEIWLFADAETADHAAFFFRLIPEDDPHALEDFALAPTRLQEELPFLPEGAASSSSLALPKPEPVRTIRSLTTSPCEAILLDEQDLNRLRRLLRTRPFSERSFLLPGPGRVLLTGPPETLRTIPFGVPLWRCGPGGFFLELGFNLSPPLPAPARKRVFGLGGDRVVALTAQKAFLFQLKNLRPAWILWAGKGPELEDGLSESATELLRRFPQIPEPPASAESVGEPSLGLPDDPRPELLRQARHAEMLGDLRGAAELLEKANELRAAARLWERAARLG